MTARYDNIIFDSQFWPKSIYLYSSYYYDYYLCQSIIMDLYIIRVFGNRIMVWFIKNGEFAGYQYDKPSKEVIDAISIAKKYMNLL